jgi:hypothetical protein
MKIALLLSGLSRSAKLCYPNLEKYLLSKHEVDIYIHTWDVSNVSLDGSLSENEIENDELINLYKPKKIVIEDYFDKRDFLNQKYLRYPKTEGTYDRSISMFYKLEECFNLVEEDYELFIRSRIDLLLNEEIDFSKVDVSSINIPVYQTTRHTFIDDTGIAYSIPPDSHGITDCFSIGNYENMKKYCTVFSKLDQMCIEMNLTYHPEYITLKNLEIQNTPINRFDLNFSLVRKPNK